MSLFLSDEPKILQSSFEREQALLAPYAFHSSESRGRKHPEPEQSYRGPFQRDRDRILHSSAFRRLSGKMQVFTGDMGDYHRTRLTHTHEVASVARTIGRALRLNEDLVEALALVHDIGHPPFGHAGEDALAECLRDEGGFSHNRHALAIAEELERRYAQFPGLNLSREVLDGQATRVDKQSSQRPLLEAQVVEAADSTAYDAHDTDDAVKLGLVGLDELATIPFVRQCMEKAREKFAGLDERLLRKTVVHELIDRQVSDVLRKSSRELAAFGFQNAAEACASSFMLGPSREMSELKVELEAFLYERVYRHPRLIEMRSEAQSRLLEMFDGYARAPELLPEKFRGRGKSVGLKRAVGEYLASMTDRYCDEQYRRHFASGR